MDECRCLQSVSAMASTSVEGRTPSNGGANRVGWTQNSNDKKTWDVDKPTRQQLSILQGYNLHNIHEVIALKKGSLDGGWTKCAEWLRASTYEEEGERKAVWPGAIPSVRVIRDMVEFWWDPPGFKKLHNNIYQIPTRRNTPTTPRSRQKFPTIMTILFDVKLPIQGPFIDPFRDRTPKRG